MALLRKKGLYETNRVHFLPESLIVPNPDQPRKHFSQPELEELALDVIERWLDEKDGETEVGRVLPREYLFFTGDGKHNHFRTEWDGGQVWDWSLQSPYEE